MQDEFVTAPLPAAEKRRSWRGVLYGTSFAFLLGAGLVGWLGWRDGYDFGTGLLPRSAKADKPLAAAAPPPVASPSANGIPPTPLASAAQVSAEQRIAELEARLARLDIQAQAASGNAARAEGLLVAFAARRMVERGGQLGYLEDQLRLRFADAQPHAVDTIIAMASQPLTMDTLSTQLEALSAQLAGVPANESGWERVKREMAALFVIRRQEAPAAAPQNRVERARRLLDEGRVDDAIAQVQLLPGADKAATWIASARRYSAALKALDLIETTALLEPRRLQDGNGQKVDQPSPLTVPAPIPAPTPASASPAAPAI